MPGPSFSCQVCAAVGQKDAIKVANEIRQFGGDIHTIRYDVTRPAADQLSFIADIGAPTHVYYFSTKRILPRRSIRDVRKLSDSSNTWIKSLGNVSTPPAHHSEFCREMSLAEQRTLLETMPATSC